MAQKSNTLPHLISKCGRHLKSCETVVEWAPVRFQCSCYCLPHHDIGSTPHSLSLLERLKWPFLRTGIPTAIPFTRTKHTHTLINPHLPTPFINCFTKHFWFLIFFKKKFIWRIVFWCNMCENNMECFCGYFCILKIWIVYQWFLLVLLLTSYLDLWRGP